MALQHGALERRASTRASVRNYLKRAGHSLEFRTEECPELVSGHIRHWIKKAFDYLVLCNARRKFEHKFDVELHGMDDDCELMARCNARREGSGMVEIDRSELRVWRQFTRHRSIGFVSSLY
jgi:hypothetical protein